LKKGPAVAGPFSFYNDIWNMNDFLKELLEYSNHFNKLIIDKFNDGDLVHVFSNRSLSLFSHIINTQSIWNQRIKGEKFKIDVWQVHPVEELANLELENFRSSLEILENEDFSRIVEYKNSNGEHFRNSVKDILFHIVNHSTYHRGQIAADFRENGIDPIVSDYIFYKRKGS